MTVITEEHILAVRRWFQINGEHHKEQIVKNPLMAEYHRGEYEMNRLADDVVGNLHLLHQSNNKDADNG